MSPDESTTQKSDRPADAALRIAETRLSPKPKSAHRSSAISDHSHPSSAPPNPAADPLAPIPPQITQCFFGIARKTLLIAQRRSFDALSHRRAQLANPRHVPPQLDRDTHVFIQIQRNQLRKSHTAQQARPDAPH